MPTTRRIFQAGFLALTLVGVFVIAGNAERWCPFGGVEALYTYLGEGDMVCSLAVTNFFVLGGLLLVTLLLRRGFCSYVCPIGTITEWLGKLAVKLGIKPRNVPQVAENLLGLLKYGVLALILYVTWTAGELHFRVADPCYALISRHGEDITFWAYVVSGAILIGAFFLSVPFCRWLCPLAAVMNPLSRFGLMRIKRDEEICLDCGKCEKACPMNIPLANVREVKAARCTSCQTCISSCPTKGASALYWGIPGRSTRRWSQTAAAIVLLGTMVSIVGASQLFPLPSFIKKRGEEPAVTETVDLRIKGITCRGSSNLFTFFLFRDDVFSVPGYLRIEAWPGQGYAPVKVHYDPEVANPELIKEAIVTPYFDEFQGYDRMSPFEIEGYAPWGDGG
ncbi:MAG: 4Fe-4S binding protein [bacterium]